MMLSPSVATPHTALSQSAPPQSVPQTTLSPLKFVPQTTLSPLNDVPQTTLSPEYTVPHTTLSPVIPIVLAMPQTTLEPQAFAVGDITPPVNRWLPQMIWRLHTDCTGSLSPGLLFL